jgi:hypothetical protein
LFRDSIAQIGGAQLRYGEPARCDYQRGSDKIAEICFHCKTAGVAHLAHLAPGDDPGLHFAALIYEQGEDIFCAAIAKQLTERLFVIRNTVLFHQGDEIERRVARQCGFREMGIGR